MAYQSMVDEFGSVSSIESLIVTRSNLMGYLEGQALDGHYFLNLDSIGSHNGCFLWWFICRCLFAIECIQFVPKKFKTLIENHQVLFLELFLLWI